jgi:hypothetical protein
MSQSLYKHVAKENGITEEQVKIVMQKSEDMMPIMLKQYGTDLNMICKKTKEYQKIMIENFKKTNKASKKK